MQVNIENCILYKYPINVLVLIYLCTFHIHMYVTQQYAQKKT